eukprot:CAMPEP_0197861716 /NCGR_PEP_ID=MMETSP1438-20131217/37947_1 /TAXON_ID=1461541 /ORGANISM="Pterosperma sp., Strain CCMP1384" /LENGTH=103 /DNA_ID=CAMNT_0043478979 /DNA_START=235 /DNA_END=546 /DNA_ORIENTATION=-
MSPVELRTLRQSANIPHYPPPGPPPSSPAVKVGTRYAPPVNSRGDVQDQVSALVSEGLLNSALGEVIVSGGPVPGPYDSEHAPPLYPKQLRSSLRRLYLERYA